MQLVSVTVNLTLNMSILDLQWNNIKINLHGIDFFVPCTIIFCLS